MDVTALWNHMAFLTCGVSRAIHKGGFRTPEAAYAWISDFLPPGVTIQCRDDLRALWARTPTTETNLTNPYLSGPIPATGEGKEFTYNEDDNAELAHLRAETTSQLPTAHNMGIANRSLSPPLAAALHSGSKRQRHASPMVPTAARPPSPYDTGAPPHAGAHIAHPAVAGPPNHPLLTQASLPFLLVKAASIAAPEEIERLIAGTTTVKNTGGYLASFGRLIRCRDAPPSDRRGRLQAPTLFIAPCKSLAVGCDLITGLANVELYGALLQPRWITAAEMAQSVTIAQQTVATAQAWAARTNDPIITQAKLMCLPAHHDALLRLMQGPADSSEILAAVSDWACGRRPPPDATPPVPPTVPATQPLPISPIAGSPTPAPPLGGRGAFTPIIPARELAAPALKTPEDERPPPPGAAGATSAILHWSAAVLQAQPPSDDMDITVADTSTAATSLDYTTAASSADHTTESEHAEPSGTEGDAHSL